MLQDRSLCGAYQFTTATWVEKHCYAKGIVVWYRNEGVRDNNTFFHPGQGEILPVDSHPAPHDHPGRQDALGRPLAGVGRAVRPRPQQSITLVQAGVGRKTYTAEPVTTFWDSSPTAYYNPAIPYNSVKTAGSGVRLRVLDANADRTVYTVQVDKK